MRNHLRPKHRLLLQNSAFLTATRVVIIFIVIAPQSNRNHQFSSDFQLFGGEGDYRVRLPTSNCWGADKVSGKRLHAIHRRRVWPYSSAKMMAARLKEGETDVTVLGTQRAPTKDYKARQGEDRETGEVPETGIKQVQHCSWPRQVRRVCRETLRKYTKMSAKPFKKTRAHFLSDAHSVKRLWCSDMQRRIGVVPARSMFERQQPDAPVFNEKAPLTLDNFVCSDECLVRLDATMFMNAQNDRVWCRLSSSKPDAIDEKESLTKPCRQHKRKKQRTNLHPRVSKTPTGCTVIVSCQRTLPHFPRFIEDFFSVRTDEDVAKISPLKQCPDLDGL